MLNGSRRAARRAMTFPAIARIGARGAAGTMIGRLRPGEGAGDATADAACLPAPSIQLRMHGAGDTRCKRAVTARRTSGHIIETRRRSPGNGVAPGIVYVHWS